MNAHNIQNSIAALQVARDSLRESVQAAEVAMQRCASSASQAELFANVAAEFGQAADEIEQLFQQASATIRSPPFQRRLAQELEAERADWWKACTQPPGYDADLERRARDPEDWEGGDSFTAA